MTDWTSTLCHLCCCWQIWQIQLLFLHRKWKTWEEELQGAIRLYLQVTPALYQSIHFLKRKGYDLLSSISILIISRNNVLKVKEHYQYPKLEGEGNNETDVFSRGPFIVSFHSPSTCKDKSLDFNKTINAHSSASRTNHQASGVQMGLWLVFTITGHSWGESRLSDQGVAMSWWCKSSLCICSTWYAD